MRGSDDTLAVVTMMYGTKFSEEYVHRLYRGVCDGLKTVRRPVNFYFHTDSEVLLEEKSIPVVTYREQPYLTGWWNKLLLFQTDFRMNCYGYQDILWLDLDTIVVGELDWLADRSHNLLTLKTQRGKTGSGVMYIPRFVSDRVWMAYESLGKPQTISPHFGDQDIIHEYWNPDDPSAYIEDVYPGRVASWKLDNVSAGIQPGVSIVYFHGRPMPHEVAHPLLKEFWYSRWPD